MRLLIVNDKAAAAWLARNAGELFGDWKVYLLSVDDTVRDMIHRMLDVPYEGITEEQLQPVRDAFRQLDPHVWVRRVLWNAQAYDLDLAIITDVHRPEYLLDAGAEELLGTKPLDIIRQLKEWGWIPGTNS